jgi:hypothetical protein
MLAGGGGLGNNKDYTVENPLGVVIRDLGGPTGNLVCGIGIQLPRKHLGEGHLCVCRNGRPWGVEGSPGSRVRDAA